MTQLTPAECRDAFELGRAVGLLEAASALLRLLAVGMVGLLLYGLWAWRKGKV